MSVTQTVYFSLYRQNSQLDLISLISKISMIFDGGLHQILNKRI